MKRAGRDRHRDWLIHQYDEIDRDAHAYRGSGVVPVPAPLPRPAARPRAIAQVGFADRLFAFELVPLELMKDNPDGLDLATPSIAFAVDDLDATRTGLEGRGAGERGGRARGARGASHSRTARVAGSPSQPDEHGIAPPADRDGTRRMDAQHPRVE